LQLPRIESDADARRATIDIMEAMSEGEITPKEADKLLNTVATAAFIMQSAEVAARLNWMEQQIAANADETPRPIRAAS
jgi:hypothetical protein